MKRARLEEFRQAAHTHLGKAQDATFELTDAILLTLLILDFGLEQGLIGSPLTTGSPLHYLLLFFRFFPNLKSLHPKLFDAFKVSKCILVLITNF